MQPSRENDLTTLIILKNCEVCRFINSKEKEINFQDEVIQNNTSYGLSR